MSITACYSLLVYCDKCNQPDDAIGETWGSTARKLRHRGWRINKAKHTALCPMCSGKPDKRVEIDQEIVEITTGGEWLRKTIKSKV